ncbi:hypothetical protein ACU4GI_46810 (plasmid) [Cupriavidus basilensis]
MTTSAETQGALELACSVPTQLAEGSAPATGVKPSRSRKKPHNVLIAGFRTLDIEFSLIQRDDTFAVRKCRLQPYGEQARTPVPDKDAGIAALVAELTNAGITGPLARVRCTRFGF